MSTPRRSREPGTREPGAPKLRRARTATESLLSITLVLEAVLVFFVMLTAYGLKSLPVAAALLGGLGLMVLLVLVSRLQRYGWGVWLGWVMQAALLATGVILPVMFFVAAVFVGIWIFCFVKARQLDRATRAYREETA